MKMTCVNFYSNLGLDVISLSFMLSCAQRQCLMRIIKERSMTWYYKAMTQMARLNELLLKDELMSCEHCPQNYEYTLCMKNA